jgi:dTDP-4-amino-4,6-dideoxy-D-galactose acyltransferase
LSSTSTLPGTDSLVRLDWECENFGFFAAQISRPDLDDSSLIDILRQARAVGVCLAVWATEENRHLNAEVTSEFAGRLVDRKATFTRPLGGSLEPESDSKKAHGQRPVIVHFAATRASDSLTDLAIAAGQYSRFRVDPAFPQDKFQDMYRLWIERSVRGELADAVLVADADCSTDEEQTRELAGMVTVAETGGVGQIGLIAVAGGMRGRGIGSALIEAAHDWMRSRGAAKARVVTQLTNQPACHLYERGGYQLSRVQNVYHFWLR